MTSCLLCGKEGHDNTKCPLFGSLRDYLAHVLPPQGGETPKRVSLAPTQFEELFGTQAEAVLADAMDDDSLSPAERALAMEICSGNKSIKKLNKGDQDVLELLTHHVSSGKPKTAAVKKPPAKNYWQNVADGEEKQRRLEDYQEGRDFYTSSNDWENLPIKTGD